MLNRSDSAVFLSPAINGKENIFRNPGSAKNIFSSANFLFSWLTHVSPVNVLNGAKRVKSRISGNASFAPGPDQGTVVAPLSLGVTSLFHSVVTRYIFLRLL